MTLTCGKCGATAEQDVRPNMVIDPGGWEVLTLTGHPILSMRLCPYCTSTIRAAISQ